MVLRKSRKLESGTANQSRKIKQQEIHERMRIGTINKTINKIVIADLNANISQDKEFTPTIGMFSAHRLCGIRRI